MHVMSFFSFSFLFSHFIHKVFSHFIPTTTFWAGTGFISDFRKRKRRPREVEQLAQGPCVCNRVQDPERKPLPGGGLA